MSGRRLEFGEKCDLCQSGAGGEPARGLLKRKERCWRESHCFTQAGTPFDAATMCSSRLQVSRRSRTRLLRIFVLSIWKVIQVLQLAVGSCQLQPAQTASTTGLSNNLRRHRHIHMLDRNPPVSNLVTMLHSLPAGECAQRESIPTAVQTKNDARHERRRWRV